MHSATTYKHTISVGRSLTERDLADISRASKLLGKISDFGHQADIRWDCMINHT